MSQISKEMQHVWANNRFVRGQGHTHILYLCVCRHLVNYFSFRPSLHHNCFPVPPSLTQSSHEWTGEDGDAGCTSFSSDTKLYVLKRFTSFESVPHRFCRRHIEPEAHGCHCVVIWIHDQPHVTSLEKYEVNRHPVFTSVSVSLKGSPSDRNPRSLFHLFNLCFLLAAAV